jgi:hypothetical protein
MVLQGLLVLLEVMDLQEQVGKVVLQQVQEQAVLQEQVVKVDQLVVQLLLELLVLQEQVVKVDQLVVQLLLELLDLQVRQVLRVQVERQP